MNEILHRNIKMLDRKLIDYFRTTDVLQNMYNIKSDAIKGVKEHNSEIEVKIDIIENEVIGILEKKPIDRTEDEILILNYARVFYSKLFKNMELVAISCKLYDNGILAKTYFFPRIVDEIVLYKKEISDKAYSYYIKFMNDEELTIKEQVIMFEYLTSKIGVISEKIYDAQRNVIRKLLDRTDNYHITGKNFYLQFINHEKCSRLGLVDAKVYIGNKDFFNVDMKSRLGRSYGKTGLIMMRESFVKNNPRDIHVKGSVSCDMKMAHVMNHELQHYYQSSFVLMGAINKTAMNMVKAHLFMKYLTLEEFDEYHINYKYKEIEREANIVAWREVELFLKEYAGKKRFRDIQISVNNLIKSSFGQAYSYQKNVSNKKQVLEEYNIENLRDIISKNPQELQSYPQLRLFFYEDGKMRPLKTLIGEYTKVVLDESKSYTDHKNYEDVYQEFFDYYFMTIALERFKLDELTINEQMEFFILVGMAYERETRKLKQMMDVYTEANRGYFNIIARKRIQRIKKYYNYLVMHQDDIAKLDRMANIKSLGFLKIESLNRHKQSFGDRIDVKNFRLKGIRLEHEIRDLATFVGDDDGGRKNGARRNC